MNTTYKEVKEYTISSVYKKEIKEEDYPEYTFIDFRPVRAGEDYIDIFYYVTTKIIGTTEEPRIIVEKKKNTRYIFEETETGDFYLDVNKVTGSFYFYNHSMAGYNYKRFILKEETF